MCAGVDARVGLWFKINVYTATLQEPTRQPLTDTVLRGGETNRTETQDEPTPGNENEAKAFIVRVWRENIKYGTQRLLR